MSRNYKYLIVNFVDEDGTFDFVPKDWIECHPGKSVLMICPFHGPNPTSIEIKLLNNLVKHCESAPDTWEKYVVDIRGNAKTYEDAEEALMRLRKEPYAFSTLDDSEPEKKIDEIKKRCREKHVLRNKDETENLFNSVACSLGTGIPTKKLQKNSDDSSSDNESNVPLSRKRKKNRPTALNKKRMPKKLKASGKISSSNGESSASEEKSRLLSKEKKLKRNKNDKENEESLSGSDNDSLLHKKIGKIPSPDSEREFLRRKQQKLSNPNDRYVFSPRKSLQKDDGDSPFFDQSTPLRRSSSAPFRSVHLPRLNADGYMIKEVMEMMRQQKAILIQVQSNVIKSQQRIVRVENMLNVLMESNAKDVEGNAVVAYPQESLENFKCTTLEDIEELDTRLKSEPDFQKSIKNCIRRVINKELPLQRILGTILKRIMARELLDIFVPRKVAKNKKVFKDLELWNCIMDASNLEFHGPKREGVEGIKNIPS